MFRFRDVTPRGFYARSLLIVLLPLIILLTGMTFFFFNSHIAEVSRKLSQTIAGDIAQVSAVMTSETESRTHAERAAEIERTLRMEVSFLDEPTLPVQKNSPFWQASRDSILEHELAVSLEDTPFWYDTGAGPSKVEIRIAPPRANGKVIRILVDRKRTFATTGHIFIVWVILFALLLIAISVGFLRNQVRSVLKLAAAAEAYGRGEQIELKPSGATEVRKAAKAISEMRDRILAHVDQRTAMLAGVSHDLRTPLTRLKLQLALLPASPDRAAARKDIDEMAAMLDEYLAFARGEEGESYEDRDLSDLVRAIATASTHMADISVSCLPDIQVRIRPLAVKRALGNLIHNAASHGKNLQVTVTHSGSFAEVIIEDDGPGIPEDRYEEAFKPFSRLDAARNQNKSGVGLGLALARDVARSHGGDVVLSPSGLGGLKAILRLPSRR